MRRNVSDVETVQRFVPNPLKFGKLVELHVY